MSHSESGSSRIDEPQNLSCALLGTGNEQLLNLSHTHAIQVSLLSRNANPKICADAHCALIGQLDTDPASE